MREIESRMLILLILVFTVFCSPPISFPRAVPGTPAGAGGELYLTLKHTVPHLFTFTPAPPAPFFVLLNTCL